MNESSSDDELDAVDYMSFAHPLTKLTQLAETTGDHLLAAKVQAALDELNLVIVRG